MQYILFAVLAPIAAILSASVAYMAWKRRAKAPAATSLAIYLIGVTGFLIFNSLELLTNEPRLKIIWNNIVYLFIGGLPVAWLAFSFQHTHRTHWLKFNRFILLTIIPLVTFVLILFNDRLHFVFKAVDVIPVEHGFTLLRVTYGPWFWVFFAHCYALILHGAAIIAWEFFSPNRLYRHQSLWLIVGAMTPLIVNLVYVLRWIPGFYKDMTPLAYALSGVAYAIGIFRFRLLQLSPVARTALLDRMKDGMLVLDRLEQVIDINRAALEIFQLKADNCIGKRIQELLPQWYMLTEQTIPLGKEFSEFAVTHEGVTRYYELQNAPLILAEPAHNGHLVLLHDVTERHLAEEALRQLNLQLELRVQMRTQDLSQRAAELTLLTSISSELRQAITLQEILNTLLKETLFALSANGGCILLLDQNRLVPTGRMMIPDACFHNTIYAQASPWKQVFQAGAVILTDPASLVFDRNPEIGTGLRAFQAVLLAPLETAQKQVGILLLCFKNQLQLSDEDMRLTTAVAEMGASAIQRVQVLENLEQIVKDRTRDLSALYEVTALTNEYLEPKALLERVLEKTLDMFSSDSGIIHLLDEDEQNLSIVVSYGLPQGLILEMQHWQAEECLWGHVRQKKRMVLTRHLRPAKTGELVDLDSDHPMYIGLPIQAHGKLLGTLTLKSAPPHRFSVEDIALLVAICDHIAVSVETARLRAQAEQAAVVEERQRLARELHDSVTQSLYSMILFADAGMQSVERTDLELVHHYLRRLQETSQQALREMRLLIYELRPQSLEEDGLMGSLQKRLEAVERRAGLSANLNAGQLPPLSTRLESAMYRISQEALNNVTKHANASQVEVNVSFMDGYVVLEVVDNGCGFELNSLRLQSGFGLSIIRERAEALGGSAEIHSQPNLGTRLMVRVPLDDPKYA